MLTIKVIKERSPKRSYRAVNCGDDVYRVMKFLEREDRENLYALHLDPRRHIIGKELISCGTLTQSSIHPREVFKGAILNNSACIILAHNHPSGSTRPSRQDVEITRTLHEAGELLGIEVVDHIIIGDGKYFSFFAKGLLKKTKKIKERVNSRMV